MSKCDAGVRWDLTVLTPDVGNSKVENNALTRKTYNPYAPLIVLLQLSQIHRHYPTFGNNLGSGAVGKLGNFTEFHPCG